MEDSFPVNVRSEVGIQSVYAFHNEYVILLEFQEIAVIDLLALGEQEMGNFDSLAIKQFVDLAVEELCVHCPETFEIRLAVRSERGQLAVHEIIVQLDDLGIQSEDSALESDSEGR